MADHDGRDLAARLGAVVAAGVRQAEIAVRVRTSQQNVARWIAGARPSERYWPALADLLQVSVEELRSWLPPSTRARRRPQPPARPVRSRQVSSDLLAELREDNQRLLRVVRELAVLAEVRLTREGRLGLAVAQVAERGSEGE